MHVARCQDARSVSAHKTVKMHWTHFRWSVPAAIVHFPNTEASCLRRETIENAGVTCLLYRHALHSRNKIWFAPFFLLVFSDDLSEFLFNDNYLHGIVGKLQTHPWLLDLVLVNLPQKILAVFCTMCFWTLSPQKLLLFIKRCCIKKHWDFLSIVPLASGAISAFLRDQTER